MKPAVVTAAIMLAFTVYFGYRIQVLANQDVSRLQKDLVQQQESQDLRDGIAVSLERIHEFEKRLAPEPEAAWLIREISKLAQEAGVQLASIEPHKPKRLNDFTHLAVSLQFSTSYHVLGQFIGRLENSYHFIRIEELDVSRGQEGVTHVRMLVSTLHATKSPVSMLSGTRTRASKRVMVADAQRRGGWNARGGRS